MKILKTRKEYDLMKDELSTEIDNFLSKFDVFLRSTSPNYWRTTGTLYTNIKNFKDEIKNIKPLTIDELEQEWIRTQVLTEEEEEEWNTQKKYNL